MYQILLPDRDPIYVSNPYVALSAVLIRHGKSRRLGMAARKKLLQQLVGEGSLVFDTEKERVVIEAMDLLPDYAEGRSVS